MDFYYINDLCTTTTYHFWSPKGGRCTYTGLTVFEFNNNCMLVITNYNNLRLFKLSFLMNFRPWFWDVLKEQPSRGKRNWYTINDNLIGVFLYFVIVNHDRKK